MESDDDLHQQTPSPMQHTNLRRLKKKASAPSPPSSLKTLDPILSILPMEVGYGSDDLEPKASADGFKGEELVMDARLEGEEAALDGSGPASDGEGSNSVLDGVMDGLKLDKLTKKKCSSREVKEKDRKKKKSQFENISDEWMSPKVSGGNKRKLEKERAAYLELIHAESQRLLRETRDASFKPIPLVQKPISSVLEKIRLRKLEVSKRSGISGSSDYLADTATSVRDANDGLESKRINSDRSHDSNDTEKVSTADFQDPSPKLNDDSQELLETPESCSKEKETKDPAESSQEEDAFTPNFLENSRPAPALSSDESSDEEYDDKENIDPHLHKVADFDRYAQGDPVKAFVDEEAEEEDDSDNDLMRFHDNEEDEDEEDNEELNDLIVSGYREKPIDCEKRDELHQKWLEQQDANATENVLQRLKSGWKQRESTLSCGMEDEEELEGSIDESMDDELPENLIRKNSKKAKLMIAQMYDDGNDGFVSSDDEETEQRLVRQRLLEQNEKHGSFLSPAEDGNSREVFGLIKKLNIVHDSKKRAKTSFFDALVTGGNSNNSSKSSFLGRSQSNSLPPLHKQGSCVARSFIFGRDDSNSRSGFSASEHSSERDQREDWPRGSVSVKFSNSQSKSISQNAKREGNASSGTSLFQILRQSSMHSDHCIQSKRQSGGFEIRQSQAAYQFSAFKSSKKAVKI